MSLVDFYLLALPVVACATVIALFWLPSPSAGERRGQPLGARSAPAAAYRRLPPPAAASRAQQPASSCLPGA